MLRVVRPAEVKLTLTAAEVGELLGYTAETVRDLARKDGRFPAPIDPTLGPKLWRWSRRRVEQYADGEAVAS